MFHSFVVYFDALGSRLERCVSRSRLSRALLLGLALLVVVTLPGCDGCLKQDAVARKKKEEEEKKKKDKEKEKPKPDFEVGGLEIQPRDPSLNQNLVKAGHWMTAVQPAKANNFDFQAELDSAATDKGGSPLDLPNTPFRVEMSRPAALPKGQGKALETLYFVPRLPRREEGFTGSRVIWFQNRLRSRQGGREVTSALTPTSTMPDYEYFLVVLAADPDRYGYLKRLDCIAPPVDEDADGMTDPVLHYRVLLPRSSGRLPLPSQSLAWTSIACLLWDGLNPNALTPDQQQSLLDWLHWGGQVIVSGPGSLDALRGSFLEPYLPADGGAALGLSPEVFTTLDAAWSLTNRQTKSRAGLQISPAKPPVGIELRQRSGAVAVEGTGDLVVERRLGAGRIVVTAFALTDRQMVNWGSYDSFFNGCLLRRPARTFRMLGPTLWPQVTWAGSTNLTSQQDARYVTGLRYFSRDTGPVDTVAGTAAERSGWPATEAGQREVAAWNDHSGAAEAARQSLREAAGISVPKAGFVFRVLAIYLLVLAPVNWAVFRALGRLEWAWVAAPVLAILGAVAIVRLAQLDIGFARSRTEIAILELQDGYRRGHLTRYTALYTSLSTAHDLVFEDDSALALPFPRQIPYQRGMHEPVTTVQFRRDRQVSLSGFQVASNSTGLVHSEQMYNLGGTLDLAGDDREGWRLKNGTPLALQDVGLVRCPAAGRYEVVWLGAVAAGQTRPVAFAASAENVPLLPEWNDSPVTAWGGPEETRRLATLDRNHDAQYSREELAGQPEWLERFNAADTDRNQQLSGDEVRRWYAAARTGELSLGSLITLACRSWRLRPGDVRLVGWTERDLPGLTITPRASQQLLRCLVLAHLRRGPWPPAQPDENLKADFPAAPAPEPGEVVPMEEP